MPLRTAFSEMNCSLARALDQMGDPWALLILRECLIGVERFDDFQQALGVARKVLADRLARLTTHGLLERVPLDGSGKRAAYRLTDKGHALVPALVAVMQWGDTWVSGSGREPVRLTGARGAVLAPVQLRTSQGKPVPPHQVRMAPGPGADRRTRGHLAQCAALQDAPGHHA
ncbi:winged helix-turn-helix transcriptional regulator [Ideonella sp. BN130291]|uniref:winged helix-turn-helix transcriptional regulator n=1 Tax=Ideonella sp. BN130291 TaxID=3112940 RepID=UPI002E25BA8B|nr:helix-turn-helix domain-containing protein [Ideonella sp. BN130291]